MTEINDDDDEPYFHMHYFKDKSAENKHGYWVKYDRVNKTSFRVCQDCLEQTRKPSESFCAFHLNQEKKLTKKQPMSKSKNVKKPSKRLDNKPKAKPRKRKIPLDNKVL